MDSDLVALSEVFCGVISLDAAQCDQLLQDLRSQGLKPRIVPAIDGRTSPIDLVGHAVNRASFRARVGYPPSETGIACALSHLAAYQAFLDTPARWAVILEDDALIRPGFGGVIGELIRHDVHAERVIVQMGTRGVAFAEPGTARGLLGRKLFRFRYVPAQTVGYLISREAALTAALAEIDGPADWPSWASRVDFWGVYPWLVTESGRPSTIREIPTNSLIRSLESITATLYLRSSGSFKGFGEFLTREWLPRVEGFIWRSRRRPRAFNAIDGPWLPLGARRHRLYWLPFHGSDVVAHAQSIDGGRGTAPRHEVEQSRGDESSSKQP